MYSGIGKNTKLTFFVFGRKYVLNDWSMKCNYCWGFLPIISVFGIPLSLLFSTDRGERKQLYQGDLIFTGCPDFGYLELSFTMKISFYRMNSINMDVLFICMAWTAWTWNTRFRVRAVSTWKSRFCGMNNSKMEFSHFQVSSKFVRIIYNSFFAEINHSNEIKINFNFIISWF
jgi:hypothetical protein